MVSALLLLSALLVSATALAVLVLLATAADHEDADKDPNATPIMTHKDEEPNVSAPYLWRETDSSC